MKGFTSKSCIQVWCRPHPYQARLSSEGKPIQSDSLALLSHLTEKQS